MKLNSSTAPCRFRSLFRFSALVLFHSDDMSGKAFSLQAQLADAWDFSETGVQTAFSALETFLDKFIEYSQSLHSPNCN